MGKESGIEVYKSKDGEIVFDVDREEGTIWATREQIARVFDVDKTVISRHIRNIFRDGELEEERVSAKNALTAADGKKYMTNFYNLDMVISIGYRVNSKKATAFRIWATKVLRNYVVNGISVNQERVKQLDGAKLKELEGTIGMVRRLMERNTLNAGEANGMLEVITKYNKSFQMLEEFDSGHISFRKTNNKVKKNLQPEMVEKVILDLKENIGESELFGKPKEGNFRDNVLRICREVSEDESLIVTEKAARLLYFVIKEKMFFDGNKRIGALLFIVFLTINDFRLTADGETKISDRALAAIALLISESEEKEKELIIGIVRKMLEG